MTISVDPAEAKRTVRSAVEECLADLPPAARVLVAVSGGADSLALAQAVALTGRPAAAGVIDHGLPVFLLTPEAVRLNLKITVPVSLSSSSTSIS